MRLVAVAQAYYWTKVWQEGERETLEEIKAGHGVVFDELEALANYLRAPQALAVGPHQRRTRRNSRNFPRQ